MIHKALLDGVVQAHGDGFELLYEFSSPNEEGECTIGALSSALWKSPFELVMGHQPLTPNALAGSYERSSPAAYKTMKEWHEQANLARGSLDKAAKKMKKWVDERRRHIEFKEIEEILSDRMIRRRGVPSYKDYLIKWHDLPDSEIVLHLTRRLSGILWKVQGGLGSPWKVLEGLGSS
ncbi:gag-aspartyl protease domain-containing protein [Tanacetum coccineum]